MYCVRHACTLISHRAYPKWSSESKQEVLRNHAVHAIIKECTVQLRFMKEMPSIRWRTRLKGNFISRNGPSIGGHPASVLFQIECSAITFGISYMS